MGLFKKHKKTWLGMLMACALCGCMTRPEKNLIAMTPTQVQFITNLNADYENFLNKTKDDIILEFGKPNRSRRYTINNEEREQFTYYLVKPGFEGEPKTLDIYIKEGIVTGFNMFDGVVLEENKSQGTLGNKISLGGV
jgi:hypothetical protein